jgi:hypothetical protein
MKKAMIGILLGVVLLNSGCATVFLGTDSASHCKIKPQPGEPQREVHVGALIFDVILFWPALIIDFVDGAIWMPCANAKQVARPISR